jgi:hypothetical protein
LLWSSLRANRPGESLQVQSTRRRPWLRALRLDRRAPAADRIRTLVSSCSSATGQHRRRELAGLPHDRSRTGATCLESRSRAPAAGASIPSRRCRAAWRVTWPASEKLARRPPNSSAGRSEPSLAG